jgi:uncharacterized protein (TIGR02246 family)
MLAALHRSTLAAPSLTKSKPRGDVMRNLTKWVFLVAGLVALSACMKGSSPGTAADADAVRAVNVAWGKAYSAGDADGVAALYAEDAVLMAPGTPPARGRTSIKDVIAKDTMGLAAAGLTAIDDPVGDVGQSGDLAWQSGAYKITDKSGAVAETGKFLTVLERKNGKWLIVRDTWNSDTAPAAAAAAPSADASAAPSK